MSIALAAADPNTAVLAAGVFDKIAELTSNGKLALQSAAGCLVLFFLLRNLIQSFTIARLVVTSLICAAALWVVFNMDSLKDRTGEDLAISVVQVVEAPDPSLDLPV
ncbi:hypothetical protein G8767_30190 [Rhodococcus sp. IC4_135]|uniref:hypothetical protein n=1 Tax=unclassified Rhodococcus (in: high G+C Gram-positive bacteria) TaxID=192944 RepID=UPI0008727CAB|nr:hypothetical protein [Rhodococcus sp. 1139]NHP17822.1 hypothetical protein [Rhodococcus sp. IC4_135]OFE08681.1 hypothetical protein A5N83_11470 [Rhodococcus sp. 1139]